MSFYESRKPEINAALRQRGALEVGPRVPGISSRNCFITKKARSESAPFIVASLFGVLEPF